ncbi:MAG: hypothetical protein ACRD3T_12715 [Terriglobia bacterium]
MNPSPGDSSPLQELITEWTAKFRGSWADFRGYFVLRRKVLADINVLAPEHAVARTIPPLKFATQGVAIVAGIAIAIALGQKLMFHGPHPPSSSGIELTDKEGRIANITGYLDTFNIHKDPPPTSEDIDEAVHQILEARVQAGLQLEELQTALDEQKEKERGVTTLEDEIHLAQAQILRRVAELRRERVLAQHIREPRGLLPEVVNQHTAYIESQLSKVNDLDSLNKAGGIDAVARQIESAPELADDMAGLLENDADFFADELNKQRIASKEDAPVRILVLQRAIELYKQPNGTPEKKRGRVQEISERISPVIQALSFVFAAYLFALFLRVGGQPKTNLELARPAYLYLFTGSLFWWNATVPVAMLLLTLLWRSSIGLWWSVALTTACILFYMVWGIRILYVVSEKLRRSFQMENPRHFYNLYRGARTIRFDLVAANFIAALVVYVSGFAVVTQFGSCSGGL